MEPTMPELAFFLITLPFSLWAAWTDLSGMRISNYFNITLFCTFLLVGILLLPLGEFGIRIGIAFLALVVGFLLNAIGQMGGGDAKYIAAFMPYVDRTEIALFFFCIANCLLAAVIVHRLARMIGPIRNIAPHWQSWTSKKFPMGLGLSGGFSLYLAIIGFGLPFGTG